jgi:hypothetical protein
VERHGILRPSRRTIRFDLEVFIGPQTDAAVVVELPRTLTVVRADPAPWRVTTVHGHPVLMWTACAALPRHPVVTARER